MTENNSGKTAFENTAAKARLKPGREKSVANRHPWVFSGAIDRQEGQAAPGDIIAVHAASGAFLGKGFWNPHSQIRLRMLTFQREAIDRDFFRRRLERALALRKEFIPPDTDTCRLVHSDGDNLPGLIVDRYGEALVMQCNSLGLAQLKSHLIQLLDLLVQPRQILERSEVAALQNEGIEAVQQWHKGGDRPEVNILENGHRFIVNLVEGQKTGFFLDQRDNRRRVGEIAAGKRLLNCFAYSGAFSVYAAARGAQTVSVDISAAAVDLARQNFALNAIDTTGHQFVTANVFEYLREKNDPQDVIVLDPPAFVKQRNHLEKGARAYKDINRLAMQLLKNSGGGLLLTCSCSGFVSWDLFRKIVFSAAQEADCEAQILAQPSQPFDHPVNIYHPEGEYLKTLLIRIG